MSFKEFDPEKGMQLRSLGPTEEDIEAAKKPENRLDSKELYEDFNEVRRLFRFVFYTLVSKDPARDGALRAKQVMNLLDELEKSCPKPPPGT